MKHDGGDLLNQLGSSSIPLPGIELRLVASLGSSAARDEDARVIERILTDYLETNLHDAARCEEKAGTTPLQAGLYQRTAEEFRNNAQRTGALLDRLARNPDWP